MDIREVELAAEMTRANIRFYEKEGLLTPERRPNGYRNYSQDDLETLKKIKLLRQLHLSVDTIRRLQQGEEDLDSALFRAMEDMSAQEDDLKRAESVCRTIRSERASYASLDAQRYLDAINAPPAGRSDYFSLRRDETPKVRSPWRRWLARQLDFGIYEIVMAALFHLTFHIREIPLILEIYIPFILMLVAEPVLLCTWGTTPGKWILGLEVRDSWERKLTFGGALHRTWGVFGKGYGYGIPIYNLVRMFKCYKACSDRGETLPWEEDLSYTRKENLPLLRGAAWAGAMAAAVFLTVTVGLQAQMPPNRGELTAAEFVENCNHLNRYFKMMPGYTLDENGQWHTLDGYVNIASPDGFELLMKDGVFTGVRFEIETDLAYYGAYYGNANEFLAVMSLLGASREVNCFTLGKLQALELLNQNYESGSVTEAGYRVSKEVESRGWQAAVGTWFGPEQGEDTFYHMVFTVEAVDESGNTP